VSRGIERLSQVFERVAQSGKKALLPYLTAGDPDLQCTGELLLAAVHGGADIIELGVPFSDPMADGPVLQQAAERALAHGTNLHGILEVAAAFNQQCDTPIILFGYYNPFFRYGLEALASDAAAAGVCGVLCVDLPPEEATPLHSALSNHGLALVPLLTPVSDASRVALARQFASAFGYYVSTTGVTGTKLSQHRDIAERIRKIRAQFGLPLVVGFGIRTPEDARDVAQWADGVVVGSALVDLVHKSPKSEKSQCVQNFLHDLSEAV
jgi:tryptophan synthase alpha chain